METLTSKLQEILKELGAEVSEMNPIGRMDFVRVTDRNHIGDNYLTIDFSGAPTVPADFHEKTHLDKTIKRLIIESV